MIIFIIINEKINYSHNSAHDENGVLVIFDTETR